MVASHVVLASCTGVGLVRGSGGGFGIPSGTSGGCPYNYMIILFSS